MSRKNFLRLSTMGMAGATLAPFQSAQAGPFKKCEALNSAGTLELSLIRGVFGAPGEYVPNFACDPFNRSALVSWDKGANNVRVQLEMETVPYRPTLSRPPGPTP